MVVYRKSTLFLVVVHNFANKSLACRDFRCKLANMEPKKRGRGRPKKTDSASRATDRHITSQLVRVDSDLFKQLAELAAKNERPAKWELERAIRAHLAASAGSVASESRQ